MWKNYESIYIVLKVAEVCNLDCPYCYFFYGGDESFQRRPKYISGQTLADVGSFVSQGIGECGTNHVSISFHGGEPLMLGKKRFVEMCDTLHRHISPLARLTLSMQTNGTLIDSEWIDIISAYEIGIGVSLDGPAHINDRMRINKNGKGSHAAIVEGIRLLGMARNRGLIRGFAVNCVITPDSNAKEVFHHFVDELGVKVFDLAPPIMDWGNYDAKQVQFVTKFYEELLELWIARNDPCLRIGAFSGMLTALLTDGGAEAYSRARSHSMPTFTIRSDGSLCPDDALSPKSEAYRNTGLGVQNNTLKEFLQADFWREIHVAYVLPRGDCETCKWAGLCGGGLAEHRFAPGEGFARKSTYCDTRMAVCNGLYDYVQSILPVDSVERRIQASNQRQFSRRAA
jgi:uncharacterized protein